MSTGFAVGLRAHIKLPGRSLESPIDPSIPIRTTRHPAWCWDPVDPMGVQGSLWDSGEPYVIPVDPCVPVWSPRDPTWCWDPVDPMGV